MPKSPRYAIAPVPRNLKCDGYQIVEMERKTASTARGCWGGGGFGEENAAKIDEEDKSGRRMVYVPCIGIGKGGDFPKPIFPINHHVHDVLYWRFQRGDRDFSE